MSSAYQPQIDGQTEVLNHYLEDYLWCFAGDNPRQWSQFLPWVEWHYNSLWHSTIKMSPFEAVFDRLPPSLADYLSATLTVASVDEILTDRTSLITS